MSKKISARAGARRRQSIENVDIELEMASLLSDLSDIYNKTLRLTEALESGGHRQSSHEAFEVSIMLKTALRICAEAMSRL